MQLDQLENERQRILDALHVLSDYGSTALRLDIRKLLGVPKPLRLRVEDSESVD